MSRLYTPINHRHAKEHNRLDELLSGLDILAKKTLLNQKQLKQISTPTTKPCRGNRHRI